MIPTRKEGRLCLLGVKIDILGGIGYNHGIQTNEVGAMAFDQTKYTTDYIKANYDRIEVRVPKGHKDMLKQLAKTHNIVDEKGKTSVSRMFVEALEEKYGVDLSKAD